jgi:cellulose synthase/poly-beta-1,6-N-acetylglucosamine synthase-like glycosyltransferase
VASGGARDALWWSGVAAAAVGVGALLAGAAWGALVAALGSLALLDLAWSRAAGRAPPPAVWALGLAGGFVLLFGAVGLSLAPGARWALALSSLQLLLAAAGATLRRPTLGRRGLDALGHATVVLASALALRGAPLAPILTCATAGLSLLALTASWSQRERGGAGEEWETLLLLALVVALAFPTLDDLVPLPAPLFLGALALCAIVAFAVLARPPAEAHRAQLPSTAGALLVAHGVAALALVNALLFSWTLVSRFALDALLVAFFAWILVSVLSDYRGVLRALARVRRRPGSARAPAAPAADASRFVSRPLATEVNVLVPARDDAEALRSSMERLLSFEAPLRFTLVASALSRDGTLEAAREIAARAGPERVRVHLGTTGSKARDLDEAWRGSDAEVFLVLDADETIGSGFVERGLARLDAEPDVGIVQGRKVVEAAGPLGRFVGAERRYATLVDHPAHADDGAAHFAGSGALLRRAALEDAGGWSDASLTEDVELTMRLRLRTRWRIAYDPTLVVREGAPRNLGHLLRQRTRWARGWVQVTSMFLGGILAPDARLSPKARLDYGWQLVAAVSAPWSSLLPLLTLLRLSGLSAVLPGPAAVLLAIVVLPARPIAFVVAGFLDETDPLPRSLPKALRLAVDAYAWIALGWLVQFHALYLEISGTPALWTVTRRFGAAAVARV